MKTTDQAKQTVAPITGQTAQIGETYQRDYHEVQGKCPDVVGSKWTGVYRSAQTVEDARAQIATIKTSDKALQGFISLPRAVHRIVHVVATCTVIE